MTTTHARAERGPEFAGVACACGREFGFGGVLSPADALAEHIEHHTAHAALAAWLHRPVHTCGYACGSAGYCIAQD